MRWRLRQMHIHIFFILFVSSKNIWVVDFVREFFFLNWVSSNSPFNHILEREDAFYICGTKLSCTELWSNTDAQFMLYFILRSSVYLSCFLNSMTFHFFIFFFILLVFISVSLFVLVLGFLFQLLSLSLDCPVINSFRV